MTTYRIETWRVNSGWHWTIITDDVEATSDFPLISEEAAMEAAVRWLGEVVAFEPLEAA